MDELERRLVACGVERDPLVAVGATGSLHRALVTELERRWPGSVLLFAPSETQAARAQLGGRRFKTDDRDCAALTYLARQGAGRRPSRGCEAMLAASAHRRGLVAERRALRQRLHDQLNGLVPGLSAPLSEGRALKLETPTGQAVLACAAAFAGAPPSVRSLVARAPGRLTQRTASYWSARWRERLSPPPDAERRAERLRRDLERYRRLEGDVVFVEQQLAVLLEHSAGQVLTSLPGVAVVRAAAFAAHSLPIERFPSAEQLYSATGLAPASYQSASTSRRAPISRTGVPEHRDALMGIAWGLSQSSPAFRERLAEFRGRGMRPIEARVALARCACRLTHRMLLSQQPYDEERYSRSRRRGR